VNEAFCRSIGYQRRELIGKHVGILAHPDVKDQVDNNISKLLSGKVLKHNEKSVRKDGSICYMELHETKVVLPGGGVGILCIADDYTEKVKAEEERMQRQKLQGALELAGAVCHELNQPLTIISITSDLLKDFPDGKNLGGNIDIIKKEISRMGEITKKLMKITKYETRQYLNGNKILDIDKASQDKA
jgi:PAS domain S-box-containing protein